MSNEAKPWFGLPVLSWGALIAGVAAILGAKLAAAGIPVFASAAASTTFAGVLVWGSARVLAARLSARVGELIAEMERRRATAEAREQLLRKLVESTPLALLFYADAGRIVYANSEACRLFFEGKSPEGQNFLRLVAQAPEALRAPLLGESDTLFTVELEGQAETYHLSRRTFPFDGETHTLLLVRHLTREVSRREVDVLKKVIRVISHELNNSLAPVASLVHSARLIAKTPAHLDKLDRVFDTIDERARHLTAFLSGYADLARIPKPVPQAAPWGPLLRQLGALFPEARIAPPPEAPGWFDAAQVEQLFINLLKNAYEAGGAKRDVELTVVPEPDGSATVEVSDLGRGLTAEALESAFLPLYSTKGRSSGLGLALCREIVEAHGGRISLRNRVGGGCTVTCWFPGRTEVADTSSRARLTLTRS